MKGGVFHFLPKILKSRYSWGDIVRVSGIYECSVCSNFEAFQKGEHFSQCQDCINNQVSEENKWYVTNQLVYFVSKNLNIEFEKIASIELHVADAITEYAGTVNFFLIHVLWFSVWVSMNIGWFGQKYVFDPFPFGLLTMIVSLEAIFLSTIILMSQNVASKKTEMRAEHEYQINLETEKNVAEILAVIKELRHETVLKHETIEEIKEAVEEIQEFHEEENRKEIEHQETMDEFETREKEIFEEQEKILEHAGIDMIEESAPPKILREKRRRRHAQHTHHEKKHQKTE